MKPRTQNRIAHALASTSVLLLGNLPLGAHSQPQSTPGLWERTMTMRAASGETAGAMAEMRKQLEAMPPAQRQQMEQMMAARGMSLPQPGGGGAGMTRRFCMTPEMAARQEVPPPDDGCTHRVTKKTATSMTMSFECPKDKSRGEGEFRFLGPKAYEGRFKMQREANGKVEAMDMDMAARWVAADCGNLAPRR